MIRLKKFANRNDGCRDGGSRSLTVVPTASALPFDVCLGMAFLRDAYEATGWAFYEIFNDTAAN